MKANKLYFNQVLMSSLVMFKNEHDKVVFCRKIGRDKIMRLPSRIEAYTGQEHGCYVIVRVNNIEMFFARFQWYLRRQFKKFSEKGKNYGKK